MTDSRPVFIRAIGYPRFCRLLTIGAVSHVTACRARVDATEAVELTATVPPVELLCIACGADLAARRQRADTRDLRPCVIELGVVADVDVDVDGIAVSRTDTDVQRGERALDVDARGDWR